MKIFVTRKIPEVGLTKLETAGHEVVVSEKDGVLTREELTAKLKAENPDAVLCLLTDKIDGEIFDAAPNAKIFANYAVGFDNIDLKEAKQRQIVITNTPDVLSEAVAEHTVALVLAIARRIVESDRFMRDGHYQGWGPLLLLGTELKSKTLVIVGCGRIGQRVAEIMHRGFGMKVSYYDRQKNETLDSELSATFTPELDELLKTADVISLHLPLTKDTKHLINSTRMGLMKPSSLLINTARGAIIDESALTEALKAGTIAGAALDVMENEPAVHPELLPLANVILSPHIASATVEARNEMSIVAANNILTILNGESPLNPIDVLD